MTNYRNFLSPACVSILLLGGSGGAVAQDSEQKKVYDEIVVTAQKREERLVDVPMSIEAFSGDELKQRGIESVQDLSFAVPGLTTREDGPGSYQIFMRGVANQYGAGALVGGYLDEVPVTLTGYDQLNVGVMDLERVEVLKGPQGTLYGQGSVAGTVRYITKKPVLDVTEGSVEGSLSSLDGGSSKRSMTGVLNVPLLRNTAALRIAANVEDGGGWIDQPEANIENGNEPEISNFRVKGLWQVSDVVTAEVMAIRYRSDTRLGLGYEQPDRTNFVAIDPSLQLIPKEYDYDLYNVDLTFDLGFAELLSATAYIDHSHDYPFSYRGGEETIYGGDLEGNDERYVEADQFSQELRLTSTGFGPFQWTVGAFYRDAEKTLDALSDTAFGGVVVGTDAPYHENTTSEEVSLFANTSYDLTSRIKVGVGVRYFQDDRTAEYLGFERRSDSFDSFDPRVYGSYAITDNANIFASVSQGFRSGGFNFGDLPTFEPESLTNYEIGTKGSLANGLVDFELTAYYSDYEDMLRRGLVFTGGMFQQLVSNIGKGEIKGIEGGLTWRPIAGLALNGTFSKIDAEVEEVNADDATNIAGDPIDYVPDIAFTLGALYNFDWTERLPGFVRIDYSYRDELPYVDRSSFPDENVPQYSDIVRLLDARIGLTYGPATYTLFGTNLTNENVYIDPYHAWENANRTRPRAVGVSAQYDFQ